MSTIEPLATLGQVAFSWQTCPEHASGLPIQRSLTSEARVRVTCILRGGSGRVTLRREYCFSCDNWVLE